MILANDIIAHAPRAKRWGKREYNEIVERGGFSGMNVFLFRGDLIEMPPQGHLHAYALGKLNAFLSLVFGSTHMVRIQCPFETPGDSMPEPDAAVVLNQHAARVPHPDRAEILVEVSDSSLELDRKQAAEYAAAAVPEYWIVDCQQRWVEVYRDIIDDPASPLGKRYSTVRVFKQGDSVSPLAQPEALLEVKTLFP